MTGWRHEVANVSHGACGVAVALLTEGERNTATDPLDTQLDHVQDLVPYPARKDAVSFKLSQFADLSKLPTPPASYGHQKELISWGVLGNDAVGDCVLAGADHETMLWNKLAGREVQFTDHTALADYSAITGYNPADPSTDQGTDMQVAASYRRKTGVVDVHGNRHKVAAYLAIKLRDEREFKTALYLFGAVGIGIEFPASAEEQFNFGVPWTVISKSPIDGGHYVPMLGYDSRYVYVVTWGRVQRATWGFISKYADEALAYVSLEALTNGKSVEGFNATQLQADLAALN